MSLDPNLAWPPLFSSLLSLARLSGPFWHTLLGHSLGPEQNHCCQPSGLA